MGFIRLYLALSVLAWHSKSLLPWKMHSGPEAVELFFSISGFYMAMVLSQGYSSTKSFYLSRFLRIYFPYIIALLFVVVISFVSKFVFNDWLQLAPYTSHPLKNNSIFGFAFAALSNLTIFLQDIVVFASFAQTPTSVHGDGLLSNYLLLPQCWSVSLELTFYLIAPYINRSKTAFLLFTLGMSVVGRLAFYQITGFAQDPWNSRFFPFELAFFLAGMLGWRLYDKYKISTRLPSCQGMWSYILCCILMLGAFYLHLQVGTWLSDHLGAAFYVLYYLSFAVAVACAFAVFRKNAIDRFIGELSFPIYLTHIIIIKLTTTVLQSYHLPESLLGPIAGLATMVTSLAFFVFAIKPFEVWRHKIVSRGEKKSLAL
ncbi:acyltransferase [bacterium]|nr:MAG: acyltransferase [bacterium]